MLIPHLFDCKPRLTVFHHFLRLTFFYFFTLSWGIDHAQSFLATFCRANSLLAHSIIFSITCTSVTRGIMMNRRQLYIISYQDCQLNTKRTSIQKYLRGLGNLCSCAAHNQVRLTLIFNTISCSRQSSKIWYV